MKLYNIYNKINQSKVGRSVCGFLIAWIVLYVFLCFSNVTQFYYDSYGYWDLSKTFWSDGGFVFKPQNFSLRAYSWPLILALLNGIGKFGLYGYWMLLGAFYSLFITVGLADLFELLFDKRITFFRRIIPVLLILLFWPGLITYPLSDVAAVLMSVIAVYFLVLLMKNRTRLGKWGGVLPAVWSDGRNIFRLGIKYQSYLQI